MTQTIATILALALSVAACGSVDAGPGEDGADAGPGDHTGDSDADPAAPAVIAVSPADGATGVAPDAHIAVSFSRPMDAASVEAAWSSADLPAGAVSFSWNSAGDTLTITPDEPLPLAEATGLDPDVIDPLSIAFSIGADARDQAGRALAGPLEVEFLTLKRLTVEIPYESDMSGSYTVSNQVDESPSSIYAGDTYNNLQIKLIVSFALPDLPAGAVLERAEFSGDQTTVTSGIYRVFGDLSLEQIRFSDIDNAFATATEEDYGVFSSSSGAGRRATAVTAGVADDLASARALSQFRLVFPIGSDADDDLDIAPFDRESLTLALDYLIE